MAPEQSQIRPTLIGGPLACPVADPVDDALVGELFALPALPLLAVVFELVLLLLDEQAPTATTAAKAHAPDRTFFHPSVTLRTSPLFRP
jgi:hypothetical protein